MTAATRAARSTPASLTGPGVTAQRKVGRRGRARRARVVQVRRAGAAWRLVQIAARQHPWMSAVLLVTAVLDALAPAASAIAVGALLRAATTGGDLLWPLVVFTAVVALPFNEVRWRL